MAVQKSKCSRSKRGMRRLHDVLKFPTNIFQDKMSKKYQLFYHLSKDGFYRGKKIF